jgi:hypothetical protein
MSQPVPDYQGKISARGPFSRRATWAAVFCGVSITTTVLIYLCFSTWLVRPSTVGLLFWLDIASSLATIVLGTRLRRPAIRPRGGWLAAIAVCLVPFSCLATVPLLGPPLETLEFRVRHANQAHFSKLAKACESYGRAHGSFPPHLAVLIAEGSILPEDLIDPFSRTAPAVLPSPLAPADWPKIAPLIDAHSDYVYTGAGLPADTKPEVIVLYDKPVSERGGRLVQRVIFQDFVEDADVAKVFADDAARRAAIHLPAIKPP